MKHSTKSSGTSSQRSSGLAEAGESPEAEGRGLEAASKAASAVARGPFVPALRGCRRRSMVSQAWLGRQQATSGAGSREQATSGACVRALRSPAGCRRSLCARPRASLQVQKKTRAPKQPFLKISK